LHPDTLSDGRVGLLGLNTDLLEDDALGVRGATEGGGLVGGSEEPLLEVEIGPLVITAMVLELARGVETSRLSYTQIVSMRCIKRRASWRFGEGGIVCRIGDCESGGVMNGGYAYLYPSSRYCRWMCWGRRVVSMADWRSKLSVVIFVRVGAPWRVAKLDQERLAQSMAYLIRYPTTYNDRSSCTIPSAAA
jgi:hypothetical protein